MKNEEIKKLWFIARHEEGMDLHSTYKYDFQSLLTGMMIKMLSRKGPEAEEQMATLRRMDDFLERLTYRNCIFHFQAKILTVQDRQIAILEQEKIDLIRENNNLKKNIK